MIDVPHPRSDQLWTLAVEGQDDKHVVRHVARIAGINIRGEQVQEYDGIERLLRAVGENLRTETGGPAGFVMDANDHPERRWRAMSDRLSNEGVSLPVTPDPDGTIITETEFHPRIGIWMMPNNSSPGELEDFVADMIPNDDPIWPRSEAYIDNIPREHRKFKGKIVRAKVLSWIATREDPGFMGQAIARGDLNTNAPLCQAFIAWLNRLFTDSDPMPVAPSP